MRPNIPTITALIFISIAEPIMARTTSQFREFFPAWQGYLLQIIENETENGCRNESVEYHDPSNTDKMLTFQLINCILEKMDEFRKTEMSITSVILGLLPTILQQVGPTVAEVSVLATRRPLLALLLGIAMPSVRTDGSLDEPLKRSADIAIRSGVLARALWPWLLISAAEYLIAVTAVANVFYQVHQLAYWSISVSAIAVDSGTLSQTYAPFLWVMLSVPAHLLGFWSLKLGYRPSEQVRNSKGVSERKTWACVIGSEFIPCAKGRPLSLDERKRGLPFILVQYLTNLASFAMFIFGTVALSSQIFISLGDVVPVIGRFICGTIVCRLILLFELYGLRELTNEPLKKDGALLSDSQKLVSGQEG
ncbi:hypothetical protein C8A03DRAFT_19173 [Achaetomium macrosporum]|uniref:Uncharacterized protein n=1 Tax=Achaetomium macrosporum TaxID=79813 RepID=A0AAN7C2H3_9PEZI|nr:hypothetical protein C8A03DRAFT_19173 [Achaetomium macrosporum]